MIANKHTELRLISNLNDLLEDSRAKQEINKKIHKHTFEYMMSYVSDNDLEDKTIYDKLEELSSSYQKHCYNIAKEIKEEILRENGEEIETYETIKGVQVEKKEIFLNPKKFTQEFKNNLEEDLSSLVIDNFFKELDNIVKVFEYNKKIDNLRKKESKNETTTHKEDIIRAIRRRIEEHYKYCLSARSGDARLVLDNFASVRNVRDSILNDAYKYIFYGLEIKVDKSDIESIFNKELDLFVKEKRIVLGLNKKSSRQHNQGKKRHNKDIGLAKAVIISQLWKDITK